MFPKRQPYGLNRVLLAWLALGLSGIAPASDGAEPHPARPATPTPPVLDATTPTPALSPQQILKQQQALLLRQRQLLNEMRHLQQESEATAATEAESRHAGTPATARTLTRTPPPPRQQTISSRSGPRGYVQNRTTRRDRAPAPTQRAPGASKAASGPSR